MGQEMKTYTSQNNKMSSHQENQCMLWPKYSHTTIRNSWVAFDDSRF